MSDQLLTPFKAYFQLDVKTTFLKFFKDSSKISLENELNRFLDDSGVSIIEKFINYNKLSFTLYDKYKKLNMKYNQVFDVSPNSLFVTNNDSELSFKVRSFDVKVLQIENGKNITFTNSENELCYIELSETLGLIKIED
jgi:hypothetical protein